MSDTGKGNKAALAFTRKGAQLAEKIMGELGGTADRSGRPDGLHLWIEKHFPKCDALIFVGAVGIAVRGIAPHVDDKSKDPAVVVVDEGGKYAIPILSGHLGGANDLARKIAEICGGEAVITTATDIQGLFAVDEWTRRQNCVILETDRIKDISSAMLAGRTITIRSAWPIRGKTPEGCMMTEATDADVALDIRTAGEKTLHVVPQICTLGIGCKRGTSASALEHFFQKLIMKTGVHEKAIVKVASIDMKEGEPGLMEFCKNHGWELETFSAIELEEVKGEFSSSGFVKDTTGVDNVCERSAALAASKLSKDNLPAKLIRGKTAGDGITMAMAMREYRPSWRWQNE